MGNSGLWSIQAFAVADHQVAHVYVRDASDIESVRGVLEKLDGVERVLDRECSRLKQESITNEAENWLLSVPGCLVHLLLLDG